ncbi:MAG: undecaprenyldiphospho-muramoylpentapeptide beta-N-acetylglucosaminyltransferase [Bacteroidetes bacterium]|nr:undecaprenyldiphospho-muramoylpentapeptide beta-N-acetylglucosaminyltransferase [Bacteroidota bacterium]
MSNCRIILAGGGTGGHIFPAISVADAIRNRIPHAQILFLGAKGRMEMEKVPEAGYAIEGLDIAGWDRKALWRNLLLPLRLLRSFWKVRLIFRRFRPQAVIGVGGYSSFPVVRYAQWAGIPNFIHESNAHAGKSNILLGRRATMVFVAVKGMERFFPAEKIQLTGNPIRSAILDISQNREDAIRYFGLNPSRRTLLSMGGSLGARSINEAMGSGLNDIRDAGLQLIWQTGRSYAATAEERCRGRHEVWTSSFIREMPIAYAAADLIVSRSGAMSVSEITAAGKPAIFVPYPLAAEDHQTANAQRLVEQRAACLVTDAAAAEQLVQTAIRVASDAATCTRMGAAARQLFVPDAADAIASHVLEVIEKPILR